MLGRFFVNRSVSSGGATWSRVGGMYHPKFGTEDFFFFLQ